MKKNEVIEFKGKKIKIPFDIYVDPVKAFELETVSNPFSGMKAIIPVFAVAVLDVIKGCELMYHNGDINSEAKTIRTMNKGREFFQKYFTDEYYTLLD